MTTISTEGRRVITGENAAGRSEFVADALTESRLYLPGYVTLLDLWRMEGFPAELAADDSPVGPPLLNPPPGGLVARLVGIPPATDPTAAGEDAAAVFERMGGAEAHLSDSSQQHAGMHRTPTVDLIYVVSGEVYAVLEEGEKLLRAGDLLVQRGTTHAWTNRTDQTAYLFAVLISTQHGTPLGVIGDSDV